MATYAKQFDYNLDGLDFTILVFEADGKIQATISVEEGAADFNALYWGDDVNDGDSVKLRDAPLNMNGAKYQGSTIDWDGATKLSSPGLGTAGTDKGTYLAEGETKTITLQGVDSIDDVDYIGVRATSTTTPEGSIKAIALGEPCPPPKPVDDDFPLWGQDISNLTFVFNQTEGDTKPNGDPDGYYTVKVDVPGSFPDDLDDSIEMLLQRMIESDQLDLAPGADLMGVVIKGGLQTTQYYAYGSYNDNGTAPDALPAGIGFTLPGDSGNVVNPNDIDVGIAYEDLFV
ncbi:hypothetical protein [Amaricoccus sp. W119]|uniref:hypothetical protein n=1 Tax=Amaricoccus sp. W119 TaxID=3391833 RepID=UPI0039A67365